MIKRVAQLLAMTIFSVIAVQAVYVINQSNREVLITTPRAEPYLQNPIPLRYGVSQRLQSSSVKLTIMGREVNIRDLAEHDSLIVSHGNHSTRHNCL